MTQQNSILIAKASLIFLLFLNALNKSLAQAPPPCTYTVNLNTHSWVPQPARVIGNGQTMCVDGNGTYYGSITVQNGGHVRVCGTANVYGSVHVQNGGTYWKEPSTGFTGSFSNNGTVNVVPYLCSGGPPCNITPNASHTDVSCFGGSDGTVTANPSGGTAPYTYVWSSGDNTQSAAGLAIGGYTVSITDAVGCSVTDNVLIDDPGFIDLQLTPSPGNPSDVRCPGGTDGTAELYVASTGGVTPFNIQWGSSAGNQTTWLANNLPAGAHTAVLTDANGCQMTYTVNINEPSPITANPAVTGTSCAGCNDGVIDFSYTGGLGAGGFDIYIDQQTGGGMSSSSTNNPTTFSLAASGDPVTAGTYDIEIWEYPSSGAPCIQNINGIVVSDPPAFLSSTQSGYWDEPGTWGGFVPVTNQQTTIQGGHSIIIRNNIDVTMDNLTVSNGASIGSENNERLVIMNDLTNDGTVDRLEVKGMTRTVNKVGIVGDLVVDLDNSNDELTVSNRITIKQKLRVDLGSLNSDLEFESGSTGTAVYDESGSGSISGGRTYIQTKLSTGDQGWRYWSPSVRDNSTWTVGGFPLQSFNGTTLVYRYIESNAINDIEDGWLAQGMAYLHPLAFAMYVGDHPNKLSGGTYTITANGDLQTGTQSYTHLMSYTGNVPSNPSRDPRGWFLMANPFQASLDWSAVQSSNTNLESSYYIWDPEFQDYESYNASTGVGTGGLDQYIPPHHGVFIKQTGTGATLVLTDAHKIYDVFNPGMKNLNNITTIPTLELSMNSANRSSSIVLRFDNGTLDFDPLLDNRNMTGQGTDLIEFSSNNGPYTVDMQVNTVGTLGQSVYNIPLSTEVVQFENLHIQLDNAVNMPSDATVYLYDKSLAIQHDICQGAYHFVSSPTDVNDRFELRIVPQASVNIDLIEEQFCKVYVTNEQLVVELKEPLQTSTTMQIVNLSGQVVQDILIPAGQTSYLFNCPELLANNLYIVSLPSLAVSNKIKW